MVRSSGRRELKLYFFIYFIIFTYLIFLSLSPSTNFTTFIVNKFKIAEENIDKKELSEKLREQNILLGLVKNITQKEINVEDNDTYTNDSEIYVIKRHVSEINRRQVILNEDIFGPIKNDSIIILIQVHNRLPHLKKLVKSLKEVKYIETSLLIFSHSFYSSEINSFVQNVRFCPVMQIFFPYSLQLYPNEFPGKSSKDCTENQTENDVTCLGNKDKFDHYRDHNLVQIKHHWWWKANVVFDNLLVTRNHNGYVIFLEEDYYVSPDLILVMKELIRANFCPLCEILSFGKQQLRDITRPMPSMNAAQIVPWTCLYNVGMAFNRKMWTKIKACAFEFCTFDDYNWDFTLSHISGKCLRQRMYALNMLSPRVFHLGLEDGTHENTKGGGMIDTLNYMNRYVNYYSYSVHRNTSKKLKLVKFVKASVYRPIKNGGWGDRRDHGLCLSFV